MNTFFLDEKKRTADSYASSLVLVKPCGGCATPFFPTQVCLLLVVYLSSVFFKEEKVKKINLFGYYVCTAARKFRPPSGSVVKLQSLSE